MFCKYPSVLVWSVSINQIENVCFCNKLSFKYPIKVTSQKEETQTNGLHCFFFIFISFYRVFDTERHKVRAYCLEHKASLDQKTGGKIHQVWSIFRNTCQNKKRSIEVLDGIVRKLAQI